MVSISNGEDSTVVQVELPSKSTDCSEVNGGYTLNNSIKGLLISENSRVSSQDKLSLIPSRLRLSEFNSTGSSFSPSATLRKIAEEKEKISQCVPSTSQGFRERFNVNIVQKVDWGSLWKLWKEWIKNPLNMALLLWIACVAVSGAILFLVMTGMLNNVLPSKSQRNIWFEVNNQILNALFTLMCLYQHPKRFHHLVLLCRWKPKDILTLRKIYCKNGTYKPHEWAHLMVVIVLLHVNCISQYALCGLNLGYRRSERPAIGVAICLSVAIGAPAVAGVYSIMSPLGKDYESEVDPEAQDQILIDGMVCSSNRRKSLERRLSFASSEQRRVENAPVWKGGLFDFWEDIATAYLSVFCSFCIFGWNMERLGFGNMYVHIATFLLFCMAPFWIFNLAAINIDNETVREALGLTGILLCVFGLLYGGFWRIQMRKRFKLPPNNLCGGNPAVGDCAQWLFCCWCSLAQEVRTANFYDIVEDKFCKKQTEEIGHSTLSPLPREGGTAHFRASIATPLGNSPSKIPMPGTENLVRFSKVHYSPDELLPKVEEEFTNNFMNPPLPSSIQREENAS
ncbi:uncharacterized protein LOC110817229 [Carica papaya]|uniref:uncharacterized protein LOC110817229 n=1 Tax=Carica papaya TaxID=3649 RepID=UPI000B8C7A0C|nr:uncharacterized protein LOC110817229 [Carica papaya]XP_021901368.1 uncharacterized protein LOC110817229 [Carica papaya]XP_021901369.1 uncharacterized protein LOC110817229 [Carica papaya]